MLILLNGVVVDKQVTVCCRFSKLNINWHSVKYISNCDHVWLYMMIQLCTHFYVTFNLPKTQFFLFE